MRASLATVLTAACLAGEGRAPAQDFEIGGAIYVDSHNGKTEALKIIAGIAYPMESGEIVTAK